MPYRSSNCVLTIAFSKIFDIIFGPHVENFKVETGIEISINKKLPYSNRENLLSKNEYHKLLPQIVCSLFILIKHYQFFVAKALLRTQI